ncbi:hypothetical protein DPX16_10465 [Anabarilius grahami]|uniref:Uncharacterized protein n=1 Tax=Anabarilius grahami TaxID=495550 RepID=A0A3N0Z6W5_ANAGA|nr:hypothetical protein DPX16_10465 [Anabarilius grahami]
MGVVMDVGDGRAHRRSGGWMASALRDCGLRTVYSAVTAEKGKDTLSRISMCKGRRGHPRVPFHQLLGILGMLVQENRTLCQNESFLRSHLQCQPLSNLPISVAPGSDAGPPPLCPATKATPQTGLFPSNLATREKRSMSSFTPSIWRTSPCEGGKAQFIIIKTKRGQGGVGCGGTGVVWLLWSGHNPARSLGLMDSLFSVTGTPWALIDASLALHLYPASPLAFCERAKRMVKK